MNNSDERRYNAGRPYYRPHNKHQVSKREDAIFLAFIAGSLLGATIALVAVTTGGLAICN